MSEQSISSTPETPESETARWLAENLKYYEEIFDFTDEDLRNKKILEIGAFDRRFAAALISAGISDDIFSLEPALAAESKEGYAQKGTLMKLIERLPKNIRDEVKKRTIVAEAENIPVTGGAFDLVIGKSVPYFSHEQLRKRIGELLRVGKEVRLYPITLDNRSDYESVVRSLDESSPITFEYKTTMEDDVSMESGIVHMKEEVLILRRKS